MQDPISPSIQSASGSGALEPGPVPLYFQILQRIRAQIASGHLKQGDPLPTEEQLCSTYAVSRITVRRALDDLFAEKLIIRKRGIGSFVAEKPSDATRSVSLVGSLYEALSYPKGMTVEIGDRGSMQAGKWVAKALGVGIRSKIYFCDVLSRVGKTPFGATTFYFPMAIGEKIAFEQLGRDTPMARLVERVVGTPVVRAEQMVEPEVATAQIAAQLGIKPMTPLLHVKRVYFSNDDTPLQAVSVRYRPDQYQLRIDLVPPRN